MSFMGSILSALRGAASGAASGALAAQSTNSAARDAAQGRFLMKHGSRSDDAARELAKTRQQEQQALEEILGALRNMPGRGNR